MWAQVVRPLRSQAHRTVRFSRTYNGQVQGPHTTYFQAPPEPPRPPRRIFRTVLLGTGCLGLGAYAHSWLLDIPFLGIGMLSEEEMLETGEGLHDAMAAAAQDAAARGMPVLDLERAQEYLELRSGYSVTAKAVAHSIQLPSNLPCEDTLHAGSYALFNDVQKDWCTWSIFDGHAGPRTSHVLREFLPVFVGAKLWDGKCMERPYKSNDWHIIQTIKSAFTEIDDNILRDASQRAQPDEGDLSHTVAIMAAALSGSCALLSLFDPARSILRVANTGDSRAVLGRWDSQAGKYIAKPMSVDQTGFNQDEVDRLNREHPDEDIVDPKTGRVHGIMVSRAFGDSRWKWPSELSQLVYEKFWGPTPRPNGVIKTPPYLTAEPEVMETIVQTDSNPDFLIMASDGLWDKMSSEDAVTCVHQWLDRYKPTGFLEKKSAVTSLTELFGRRDSAFKQITSTSASDPGLDEETYWDPDEQAMNWRVSPKHFVVEDEHCGVHLIKNALGGKRRNLFCGVLSMQPPRSRSLRDDITVHVIFFGVDTQDAMKV